MLSFTQIKSESDFWERLDTLFGPIRPFSGLSWNGRKLLFQTSLTVKNSTHWVPDTTKTLSCKDIDD